MTSQTATLLGAILAGSVAIVLALFNSWRQSALEYKKWRLARQDAQNTQLRNAVAELVKKIAIGNHAIGWLTWTASFEPESFNESNLLAYDKKISDLFPEIVSSRIVLAALSGELHNRLSPLVAELYQIDVQVAEAGTLFKKRDRKGLAKLAEIYSTVREFDEKLLRESTGLLVESIRDGN
jgi:hypothetical protein